MTFCAVVSLGLLVAVTGCTSAATPPAEHPEKARIAELEKENARLTDRLARAEHERDEARRSARPAAPRAAEAPRPAETPTEAPGSLPEVPLGELEAPGPGVVKLGPAAAPSEEEPEPRLRPVVRVHGTEDGEVTQVVDGGDQREAPASSEYESALALVQKKKYEQGESALRSFIAQHPNHPFTDNALYWLGECQYARGDYAGAVQSFEAVVTRYPSENKVPDALLKIALSQERLGHDGASQQAIGRLLKEHPDTAAARRVPERYLSK